VINKIYVDSSSLLRIATGDHDGAELNETLQKYINLGIEPISSKLLELECHRASVRLAYEGQPPLRIERLLERFRLLAITDQIWEIAMGIEVPIKSLDAIHLATCSILSDCVLLTSDKNMRAVAAGMGIKLA
jgi:predicted nucleic acid-binding protein